MAPRHRGERRDPYLQGRTSESGGEETETRSARVTREKWADKQAQGAGIHEGKSHTPELRREKPLAWGKASVSAQSPRQARAGGTRTSKGRHREKRMGATGRSTARQERARGLREKTGRPLADFNGPRPRKLITQEVLGALDVTIYDASPRGEPAGEEATRRLPGLARSPSGNGPRCHPVTGGRPLSLASPPPRDRAGFPLALD